MASYHACFTLQLQEDCSTASSKFAKVADIETEAVKLELQPC